MVIYRGEGLTILEWLFWRVMMTDDEQFAQFWSVIDYANEVNVTLTICKMSLYLMQNSLCICPIPTSNQR